MAQDLLHLLGGVIGDTGKDAEGGYVDEHPVAVELAHIAGERGAGDGDLRRLAEVGGEAEGFGEVVGAACGQVAQGLLQAAVDDS